MMGLVTQYYTSSSPQARSGMIVDYSAIQLYLACCDSQSQKDIWRGTRAELLLFYAGWF